MAKQATWISQDVLLSKIIDHPVNAAIYQDNFDDSLVESIKEWGVREPVHVTKHGGGSYICLSGHRRRQAAKLAGLEEVPCRIFIGEMSEAEQVIHVCETNRQRVKTVEQRARESERLAEAKATLAKNRMKSGKSDPAANLPQGSREDRMALTEAAKESGLGSRHTAEKAIEVVHEIDAAKAAGDTARAEDLADTLNNKSVKAAHEKAKGKNPPRKPAKPSASNGKTTVVGYDASEFVKPLGAFVRQVDDAATACGINNGQSHKKLLSALSEAYDLATQFAKECNAIAQRKAKGK